MMTAIAGMRISALTALVVLTGCDITQATFTNLRELEDVPEVYLEWFELTVRCMDDEGLPSSNARFDRIRWYVADHIDYGDNTLGLHRAPNMIVIKDGHLLDSLVVRHELGHYVTVEGTKIHRDEWARGRSICDGGPHE